MHYLYVLITTFCSESDRDEGVCKHTHVLLSQKNAEEQKVKSVQQVAIAITTACIMRSSGNVK